MDVEKRLEGDSGSIIHDVGFLDNEFIVFEQFNDIDFAQPHAAFVSITIFISFQIVRTPLLEE